MFEIHNMDCVAAMRSLPDNSVDSIVTDPPYELGFMGKGWDSTGIANSVEMWREALRVLKPGGHLLAFSGSRTYHRMTCAIEDAGFDIRDQIMWVYGSGFPKSLDVSKAIDKQAGAEREVLSEGKAVKRMIPGADQDSTGSWIKDNGREYVPTVTAPATDAARQWEGWGTALKPAHEPICVARKPLIGTVAANVLAHGTGALNIDGCRVATDDNLNGGAYSVDRQASTSEWAASGSLHESTGEAFVQPPGRWPANLIHDGSDEVVALFPGQAGAAAAPVRGTEASAASTGNVTGERARVAGAFHADNGSAARFFYCAKTSKTDRNAGLDRFPVARSNERADGGKSIYESSTQEPRANTHPTVKPTDLMAYLVRLVTPPGGLVLDPFMGSGSTGKACMREGMRFIGCELSAEYVAIAEARIVHELSGGLL